MHVESKCNYNAVHFASVGHKKNMRSYWTNYFQDTDLVIFCVDSADEDRLPKAYDEFHTIQADERLKGVPIIILATKQVVDRFFN